MISVYIGVGMMVQSLEIFTLYHSITLGNIGNLKWKHSTDPDSELWLKQS